LASAVIVLLAGSWCAADLVWSEDLDSGIGRMNVVDGAGSVVFVHDPFDGDINASFVRRNPNTADGLDLRVASLGCGFDPEDMIALTVEWLPVAADGDLALPQFGFFDSETGQPIAVVRIRNSASEGNGYDVLIMVGNNGGPQIFEVDLPAWQFGQEYSLVLQVDGPGGTLSISSSIWQVNRFVSQGIDTIALPGNALLQYDSIGMANTVATGFEGSTLLAEIDTMSVFADRQDCNANEVPDDCDVTAATSPDCNLDGMPDECQLSSNDCNTDGVPDDCEADADDDGTIDVCDACPADAGKSEAGVCGCGVADTDSDGDGMADCNDGCPDDAGKIEPGICGCGVADTDTDVDNVADCQDNCPSDSRKTEPGVCGCGVADTDSDGDSMADCNDGCPDDALKTEAGLCGCGVSDVDADNDRVADCQDRCLSTDSGMEVDADGCAVVLEEADEDAVGQPVTDVEGSDAGDGVNTPDTSGNGNGGGDGQASGSGRNAQFRNPFFGMCGAFGLTYYAPTLLGFMLLKRRARRDR
jgi:hypothetical protein